VSAEAIGVGDRFQSSRPALYPLETKYLYGIFLMGYVFELQILGKNDYRKTKNACT
jgi:hypothetical protein